MDVKYKAKFVKCKGRESSLTSICQNPMFARWSGPNSTTEHATHVFATYRTSLSTLRVGIRLIYIFNCMTTFYFMTTFISPQFEVFIFVFLNCMTTFLFLFLFQFLDCCRNEGKRFKFLVEDVSVVFSG